MFGFLGKWDLWLKLEIVDQRLTEGQRVKFHPWRFVLKKKKKKKKKGLISKPRKLFKCNLYFCFSKSNRNLTKKWRL